jgi:hypothetical protein
MTFGLSFKMENHDILYNTATRKFDMVESNDSIPQTIDHYILVQLGELPLHPDFGIDIYAIMTSPFPHTMMVNELRNLEGKLGLKNFECTVSEDGRRADITGSLEKET